MEVALKTTPKKDIIILNDVSWQYEDTENYAIENINLTIREGEIVVITGPSGAGKTTLCRTLNGLIPHFYRGLLKGSVRIERLDTRKSDLISFSTKVGMVIDNPSNQLFSSTVIEEVAFGPSNIVDTREELLERVYEAMKFTRIEKYKDKNPHYLSGGEKQAVAIAAMIAMRPKILVLDEPTGNLDPYGTRLVFERIYELAKEGNRTLIIVEHKLDKILPYADRLIVMSDGKIVVNGPPSEVLKSDVIWNLKIEVPQVTRFIYYLFNGNLPDINLPVTVDEAEGLLRRLIEEDKVKINRNVQRIEGNERLSKKSEPIISCNNVWYKYPDETVALRGVNLEIYEGEFIGIVGKNGSGKTTLAKMLNGLYKPTEGDVIIYGYNTREYDVGYLSKIVGYSFQNPDDQLFAKTVGEELEFGLKNLKLPPEEIEKRVSKVAKDFEIDKYLDESPFSLSQGLRQRIAVASVMIMEPKVLIVDEPTTGQDYSRSKVILDLMRKLYEEGRTMIVISHDMDLVAEYCNRLIVMLDGKILADGSPREIFSKPEILSQTSLEPPQITQLAQRLSDMDIPKDILTIDEMLSYFSLEG